MAIAIEPSSNSVVAAFLLFGGLKAGTPLEMASTPVSAAQPDENVRRSRNTNAKLVRWLSSAEITRSALGARRSWPRMNTRTSPVRIIAMMTMMNAYVGMENAVPDSRRPRRFMAVSKATAPIAMPTRFSATNGTTEPRLLTPADTETATVRM
jgi:hypothetical protein